MTPDTPDVEPPSALQEAIVEQLRAVWNARGVADLQLLNERTQEKFLMVPPDPYTRETLWAAVKTLDR